MRLLCAAAAAALSMVSSLASASTIYTYVGQNYTSATLPYTTSDSVTGSFTLDTPLGDNLQDVTVTPTSFSFSDGVQTITDATAFASSFGDLSTDSNGDITGFYIQIDNLTQGFIKLSGVGSGLSGDSVRLTLGDSASNALAGSFQTSGTGTSVTPEPSSMLLLGTGILALAAVMRRRPAACEAGRTSWMSGTR